MEGVMIANPRHKYLQYNPYTKLMLIERYDFDLMIKVRQEELVRCKIKPDTTVGVVMGVLGRQGSSHIVNRIIDELKSRNVKFITLLVSELSVEQLQCFREYVNVNSRSVQFFVQVACPRLSIDWGKYFDKPLLTPYEFYSLIGKVDFSTESTLPAYARLSYGLLFRQRG